MKVGKTFQEYKNQSNDSNANILEIDINNIFIQAIGDADSLWLTYQGRLKSSLKGMNLINMLDKSNNKWQVINLVK